MKNSSSTVYGVFIVRNMRGLHTRPCTEIVKCAVRYKSDIKLIVKNQIVNAKSLLGILMMAATKGTRITITATGDDAEQAVEALLQLAENQFYINY